MKIEYGVPKGMGRSPAIKKSKKNEDAQVKVENEELPKLTIEDTDEDDMEEEDLDNEDEDLDEKDDILFNPNNEGLEEQEEGMDKKEDFYDVQTNENLIIPKYHVKKMAEKIFHELGRDLKISSKARGLIHLHCEAFLIDVFDQCRDIMELNKVKTLNRKTLSKVFQWKCKSLLHVKQTKACKRMTRRNEGATQCEQSVA